MAQQSSAFVADGTRRWCSLFRFATGDQAAGGRTGSTAVQADSADRDAVISLVRQLLDVLFRSMPDRFR
ncbi:hypothetical protein MJ579_12950 [Klebsiella pneumoniae]|nr:hypothetical protein MJ579_12950 [Klebsiella pneumoniae]